ncbi:MAG: hypothetical protein ACU0DK_10750 [Pseudooceanicola sp.]
MSDDENDDLPASDAELVRKAQRRTGHGGGTPPADPASEAARILARPAPKSRGEAKAERIARARREE